MDTDVLVFAPEENVEVRYDEPFNVLIVDDDLEVHTFTKIALRDFVYANRKINFLSAYSAQEALQLYKNDRNIALILLDVVMESDTAGLDVVQEIRSNFQDNIIRIIIRTGQAGKAPERYVIDHYDINDYKEKTELTSDKLYTSIRTALSQYKQLKELLNKKDEIYYRLITDSLTSLPNRIKLNSDLDSSSPKSLIMLNIDSFGMINDVYGFHIGDELLIQFSYLLKELTDENIWSVYRLESDLFALLRTHDEVADTSVEVNGLKKAISEKSFIIGGVDYRINVTIGIVENEIGNIIQKAEFALREARKHGRNRVQQYSENLNVINQIEENTKWTKWLKEALDNDKIIAYFQPIVDCSNDKIVKYETLVRLEKEGTIYTPNYFLATARYAGLLYEITKRMFQQACEKFSDNDLIFSINITDQDLIEEDFVEFIEQTSKKYNIAPHRVHFEILEDNNILDNPIAQKHLKEITNYGYKLCLDDFGIQCSNFAQVGNLDLECLKIDGSYIHDIDENDTSKDVTDSILYFTRKIEVKTVAEFVHKKEIYEIVKKLGVNYAQGYFLGKPLPELI